MEPIKNRLLKELLKSNCSTSFFKFFLSSSPSSLETPSLTAEGALSTRSFASLRPRPVASRTALITATLFAPKEVNSTLNSVCSSAAAAPARSSSNSYSSSRYIEFLFESRDQFNKLKNSFSATAFKISSLVKAMRVTPNGY